MAALNECRRKCIKANCRPNYDKSGEVVWHRQDGDNEHCTGRISGLWEQKQIREEVGSQGFGAQNSSVGGKTRIAQCDKIHRKGGRTRSQVSSHTQNGNSAPWGNMAQQATRNNRHTPVHALRAAWTRGGHQADA